MLATSPTLLNKVRLKTKNRSGAVALHAILRPCFWEVVMDDAPLGPEAEEVRSREPRGLMSRNQPIPSGMARRIASWNAMIMSCEEYVSGSCPVGTPKDGAWPALQPLLE